MQSFPHRYRVNASGHVRGSVNVGGAELPHIETWAPPEFDGPRGHWSPESLLVAAVADCYVLSFRVVARAARLEWLELSVDVEGELDRVDGATRFTKFTIEPHLKLANAEDLGRTGGVLADAKRICLITNSLNAPCVLRRPQPAPAEADA